jgi:hypothetical protein
MGLLLVSNIFMTFAWSLNFSQCVERRKWCPWAREGLEEVRVLAGDEPCNEEEICHASTRFDALQQCDTLSEGGLCGIFFLDRYFSRKKSRVKSLFSLR